jgi:hypothetical protein
MSASASSGDAARVAKRCVEHRNAARCRVVERHLIGADAKAAHGQELSGRLDHARRELRFRANAEYVRFANQREQLLFARRAIAQVGVIAGLGEGHHGIGMNALEQQDVDFFLWDSSSATRFALASVVVVSKGGKLSVGNDSRQQRPVDRYRAARLISCAY